MKKISVVIILMLWISANFAVSQTAPIAQNEKITDRVNTEKTAGGETNAGSERAKIIARIVVEQPKPLTLNEAITMALQNNADL